METISIGNGIRSLKRVDTKWPSLEVTWDSITFYTLQDSAWVETEILGLYLFFSVSNNDSITLYTLQDSITLYTLETE